MGKPQLPLSSQFLLQNSVFEVNLSYADLTWRILCKAKSPLRKCKLVSSSVPVSEIITVRETEGVSQAADNGRLLKTAQEQDRPCENAFTVSYVKREHGHRWQLSDVTFKCPDRALCQQWVQTIRDLLGAFTCRPKRLLVFINPYGGKQRGKQIYEQKVAPLFSHASVSTHVIVTKCSNHARDHLAGDADLKKYDGVVCVGGDGMFSEVIHGLISRTQRDAGVDQNNTKENLVPSQIRVGIIPAGSTDCICYATVGTNDPVTSALHILVGDSQLIDVCSAYKKNKFLKFSVSLLGYGFYGDVLSDSENRRWMGPARYSFSGLKTFLAHHSYEGTVCYLPARDVLGSPTDKHKCRAGCPHCHHNGQLLSGGHLSKRSEDIPDQGGWQVAQGRFLAINIASMSCACPRSPDGLSPSAHLADGTADLILVRDCSRFSFFTHLLRHTNRHDQLALPFVEVHRVRRFRFIPGHHESEEPALKNRRDVLEESCVNRAANSAPLWSSWTCDGEILPEAVGIDVSVHYGLIRLFARGIEEKESL